MESRVNSYGTVFPKTIASAEGEYLIPADGKRYFDMFSSAGVANFGHNHPRIRQAIIDYLQENGVVHGLDYFTTTKQRFIEKFEATALARHRGEYRYYFSPPAGTLAIEAAVKYARKATGRRTLGCFTNAFHGLTYNALSMTGNLSKRRAAYGDLASVARFPYDGYLGAGVDLLSLYRKQIHDASGGYDAPAAIVFETIQAEGGVHACSREWYEGVLDLCKEEGIVSIVDDIQTGCGRSGGFFSFDQISDRMPDIICMAKGVSGFGLPCSLVIVKKELDILDPGENSGTFRGNNLGVRAGTAMLELYATDECRALIAGNERLAADALKDVPSRFDVRGRGLLYGVDMHDAELAKRLQSRLTEHGVLVERCGGSPAVVKIMPPLVSRPDELGRALAIVREHLATID
jgi:diaminobutyrate-2-oxoglutarate transaminase